MVKPNKYGPRPANGTSASQWNQKPQTDKRIFVGFAPKSDTGGEKPVQFGATKEQLDRLQRRKADLFFHGPVENVPMKDPIYVKPNPERYSEKREQNNLLYGSGNVKIGRDGTVFALPGRTASPMDRDGWKRENETFRKYNGERDFRMVENQAATKGGKSRKRVKTSIKRDASIFRKGRQK